MKHIYWITMELNRCLVFLALMASPQERGLVVGEVKQFKSNKMTTECSNYICNWQHGKWSAYTYWHQCALATLNEEYQSKAMFQYSMTFVMWLMSKGEKSLHCQVIEPKNWHRVTEFLSHTGSLCTPSKCCFWSLVIS